METLSKLLDLTPLIITDIRWKVIYCGTAFLTLRHEIVELGLLPIVAHIRLALMLPRHRTIHSFAAAKASHPILILFIHGEAILVKSWWQRVTSFFATNMGRRCALSTKRSSRIVTLRILDTFKTIACLFDIHHLVELSSILHMWLFPGSHYLRAAVIVCIIPQVGLIFHTFRQVAHDQIRMTVNAWELKLLIVTSL